MPTDPELIKQIMVKDFDSFTDRAVSDLSHHYRDMSNYNNITTVNYGLEAHHYMYSDKV